MINIYFFTEKELKSLLKRDLKNTSEENYFIINKKWMDNFKQLFGYEQKFLNYLKSLNINDVINKYNPNEKYDEFLSVIEKLFVDENEYINEINSTSSNEKNNELTNAQNYKNI